MTLNDVEIMGQIFLIHYGEIALKKGNRRFFEQKLVENIKRAVLDLGKFEVQRLYGRIILKINKLNENKEKMVIEKLKKVFGISNFALAVETDRDIENLKKEAWSLAKNIEFNSFRIDCKRGDKNYPLTSQEVNVEVGSYVWRQFEKERGKKPKVDLKNPDVAVFIEITEKSAYLYSDSQKFKGAGGLPTGTAGKVISLLSAGFDSPVAAWKIMRRGAKVAFVHFHGAPYTSEEAKNAVLDIIKILDEYQGESKVYIVPFADVQKTIVKSCDPKLRVILYRRMMLRIAENIAKIENAKAFITGDSLAQVASQTLKNIVAISDVTNIPIFRPLIGEDKQDIIDLAREVGTHKISVMNFDDCCSLFVPEHPETQADLKEVKEAEKNIDAGGLIEKAMSETEVIRDGCNS